MNREAITVLAVIVDAPKSYGFPRPFPFFPAGSP